MKDDTSLTVSGNSLTPLSRLDYPNPDYPSPMWPTVELTTVPTGDTREIDTLKSFMLNIPGILTVLVVCSYNVALVVSPLSTLLRIIQKM